MPFLSTSFRSLFGLDLSFLALVRREALVLSRRFWPFAATTGFLLVLSVLLAWVWGDAVSSDRVRLAAVSAVAQVMFMLLLYGYLVAGGVAAVAAAATSIVLERERGTLEMLLATPVSITGLLAGKAFHACAAVLGLLLAAGPLFGLFFVFVGMDMDVVVRSLGYATLSILAAGALALWISARSKHTVASVGTAFLVVAFLWGGLPMANIVLSGLDIFPSSDILPPVSPIVAVVGAPLGDTEFALQGLLLLFGLGGAWLALRNPFAPAHNLLRIPGAKRIGPWFAGGSLLLRPWNPARRRIAFNDNVNALFHLDFHWGFARQSRRVMLPLELFLLGAGVIWFLILAQDTYFFAEPALLAVFVLAGAVTAAAALFGAPTFSVEWDRERQDLLASSLISPEEALSGKMHGVLLRLLPFQAAFLLALLPFALVSEWSEPWTREWPVGLAIGSFLFAQIDVFILIQFSLLASLALRRTTRALMASLLVGAFFLLGLPVGLLLLNRVVLNIPENVLAFTLAISSSAMSGAFIGLWNDGPMSWASTTCLLGIIACLCLRLGLTALLRLALTKLCRERLRHP